MVYELRIYHVLPGKIENLVARFRDHTMKLFADHGIKSVAPARRHRSRCDRQAQTWLSIPCRD